MHFSGESVHIAFLGVSEGLTGAEHQGASPTKGEQWCRSPAGRREKERSDLTNRRGEGERLTGRTSQRLMILNTVKRGS